jgi:hypothetical protein
MRAVISHLNYPCQNSCCSVSLDEGGWLSNSSDKVAIASLLTIEAGDQTHFKNLRVPIG